VLILLGALVGLCLAYWLLLLNEQRVERKAYEAKRLFSFAPEDVREITIQREGERATSGERREQGGWTITAPYRVRANPLIWDRVARNLAELLSERTIYESAPENLEDYGLAEPVLNVDAKTGEGDSVAVSFGSMEPTQKYRYGLVEGGPLFLASTDQFFELDRSLNEWLRDRDLVKVGNDGIRRIAVAPFERKEDAPEGATGPETWKAFKPVAAERREDGLWYIVEPEPAVADQKTLNELAAEIQYVKGREYVDAPENLTDYHLDPPKSRVTVKTGASGEEQTFFVGGFSTGEDTEGGVFVKREDEPAVFVVDAQMVTLFPKTPTAWNEKRVVTRSGTSITSIEYWAGEQHFKLETAEGQPWRLVEPREEESDQAAVSQFIGALLNAKGTDYWPEAKSEFGLDDPIIRMHVGFGEESADIRVGALTEDEKARYVTQDTGDVVALPIEQVEKLVVAFTDLVAKGLLHFRESDVNEVSLIFEGTSYIFARGESAWKVAEPAGKVWESQSDMRALLDGLSGMRAVAIEECPAPADVAPYGLDEPVLTVRLTAREKADNENQAIIGPLVIGSLCEDDPHQRYAMAAGRLDLFRVKQDIIDTVRDALRGVVDD